jgi:hypothetical protein
VSDGDQDANTPADDGRWQMHGFDFWIGVA